ncbi:hypothetical protein N9973_00380 [bacterium]|nr:hypothetical protein [bacterium]
MKCLVKTTGWIGDSLFCIPLAELLKKEKGYTQVDFYIYLPQPFLLIANDPYIDNVYVCGVSEPKDDSIYDSIFTMPVCSVVDKPPTHIFQQHCGIKKLKSEFNITTTKQHDDYATYFLSTLPIRKSIAIQGDWGKRRWFVENDNFVKGEVSSIISELHDSNNFNLINISHEANSSLRDVRGYDADPERYSLMASIIKHCDLFIGAEGGLTNLASGVGTKCIITTCHMERDRIIKKHDCSILGPESMFPNCGHIHAHPHSTNDDIIKLIYKTLK